MSQAAEVGPHPSSALPQVHLGPENICGCSSGSFSVRASAPPHIPPPHGAATFVFNKLLCRFICFSVCEWQSSTMKVSPARPGEEGSDLFTQLVQSQISMMRAITQKHQVEYQRSLGGLAVAWVLGGKEGGQLLYFQMCHRAASHTWSSTQVLSLQEPRDKPPHAFPSYAFLSTPLSPGGPWRVPPPVPTTPSPVPPSPPLPRMRSPPRDFTPSSTLRAAPTRRHQH